MTGASESVERHPMLETWIAEWSNAYYVGDDAAWITRIEFAKEIVRLRSQLSASVPREVATLALTMWMRDKDNVIGGYEPKFKTREDCLTAALQEHQRRET